MESLKFKKLNPAAAIPFKATEGSACFDLKALLESPVTLQPGSIYPVPTGLAIEMPSPECVALVFSRSGMGSKYGITLANSVGVIDYDYRGELKVSLINNGTEPYTINDGDRIAQLMVVRTVLLNPCESDTLSETARGEGGFGSTGRN